MISSFVSTQLGRLKLLVFVKPLIQFLSYLVNVISRVNIFRLLLACSLNIQGWSFRKFLCRYLLRSISWIVFLLLRFLLLVNMVWNMFKVNNKDTRTAPLWTYFTPFSSVSIVNFELVNAGWEVSIRKKKLGTDTRCPFPWAFSYGFVRKVCIKC